MSTLKNIAIAAATVIVVYPLAEFVWWVLGPRWARTPARASLAWDEADWSGDL